MKPYYHDDAAGITIYHGDCRALALPERPALVLTDPPYGIAYNPSGGDGLAQRGNLPPVEGDAEPFDPSHLLALGAPAILWGGNHFADRLPASPSWLVWYKRDGLPQVQFADCEMAWTNLGGPARVYNHPWHGMLRASERGVKRSHPTQKPVALMRWCLQRARLAPGALVYDPYMGSGPLAQACKELGYRYIGVELVEAYAEIAARRLSQEVMAL